MLLESMVKPLHLLGFFDIQMGVTFVSISPISYNIFLKDTLIGKYINYINL